MVCTILAIVVLLQIRHWHGRALDALRDEDERRRGAPGDRRPAERRSREARGGRAPAQDEPASRRRAA